MNANDPRTGGEGAGPVASERKTPPENPTTRVLLANYGALLLLLALTAAASFARLGALQMPVALGIAAVKMLLVFFVFMQLWYRRGLIRVFAFAGFFWLLICVVLMFADYVTRGWRL